MVAALPTSSDGGAPAMAADDRALLASLTPREREVLDLIRLGLSNAEAARRLCISPGTVRKHLENAFGRLGVHSRTEAVAVISGIARTLPGNLAAPGQLDNLPRLPTSFVGREPLLDELVGMLDRSRLVTVVGAPGVGKTRLAIETALRVLHRFDHGAWLAQLAGIRDPGSVPSEVLAALGGSTGRHGGALSALVAYARPVRSLLILDNCEHLLPEIQEVAEALVSRTEHLRILATSRQPLGAAGEQVVTVEPLPVPPLSTPVGELEGSPSVRLFLDRAAGSVSGFELTLANAAAVAAVCRHLDGLPLALELAASRLRAFAPDQIADRLTDRFRILAGTKAEPRHQTLQAAIEWSFDNLTPVDQTLLGRLGVFAGTFSLSAVETVCVDEQISSAQAAAALASLVDRSLVQVETDGISHRYRLLESIREFAWGRVDDSAQTAARHARVLAALAEEAAPKLSGSEQQLWMEIIAQELDNIRRALEWTVENSDHDLSLRLVGDLGAFWDVSGRRTEGIAWSERVLACAPKKVSRARARALTAAATLHLRAGGDPARSIELASTAMAIAADLADEFCYHDAQLTRGAALTFRDRDLSLADLGQANSFFVGRADHRRAAWTLYFMSLSLDLGAAAKALGQATQLAESLRDRRLLADVAYVLAMRTAQEDRDIAVAARRAGRAMLLAAALGHEHPMTHARSVLAMVALRRGDLDETAELAAHCRSMFHRLGDIQCRARMTCLLAARAEAGHDYRQAVDDYRQAAADAADADPRTAADSLDGLAGLVDGPEAIRYAAAAATIRARLAVARSLYIRDPSERLGRLRGALGPDRFMATWAEGSQASVGHLLSRVSSLGALSSLTSGSPR